MLYLNVENSFFLINWHTITLSLIILMVILFLTRKSLKKNNGSKKHDDIIMYDNDKKFKTDSEDDIEGTTSSSLGSVNYIPYFSGAENLEGGANKFYKIMNKRRSIRSFSSEPIDVEIIKKCIQVAGSAPSGAHTEPWTFCLVKNANLKSHIREIIEEEEYINYKQRMSRQWTMDLKPLKTNYIKEYLTDAPYLILVFKQTYGTRLDGKRKTHYYHEISTSISVGFLLCALQCAGLSTVITTPMNCGTTIKKLLQRPPNEKLIVLLPVGYPSSDCMVPDLKRKSIKQILSVY